MNINDYQWAAKEMAHVLYLGPNEPIFSDIGTVIEINANGEKKIYSDVNARNNAGYRPFRSIPIGFVQICNNLMEIIKNVGLTIQGRQSLFTTGQKLGWNVVLILRGALELIPFAGNLIIYSIDQIRVKIIELRINQDVEGQKDIRNYYANGRSICSGTNKNSIDDDFKFMYQVGLKIG